MNSASPVTEARPMARATPMHAARFLQTSALSFVSYLGLTALLTEAAGVAPWASTLIAIVLVTKTNFWLMRRYVFPGEHAGWPRQFAGFVASIAVFRVLEYTAYLAGITLLGLPYLPCYAVILCVSFVLKFTVFSKHVFNRPVTQTTRA